MAQGKMDLSIGSDYRGEFQPILLRPQSLDLFPGPHIQLIQKLLLDLRNMLGDRGIVKGS